MGSRRKRGLAETKWIWRPSYNETPTKRGRRIFPLRIYESFQRDSRLLRQATRSILAGHFPTSLHSDILSYVGLDGQVNPVSVGRDAAFRRAVVAAYGHQCALCGFAVQLGDGIDLALEAAHLKWHQAGGPEIVQNGLALCSIHHKGFDLGAMSIDSKHRITLSGELHGHTGLTDWFLKFHGRAVAQPHSKSLLPDPGFVAWHRREVFRAPPRDLA